MKELNFDIKIPKGYQKFVFEMVVKRKGLFCNKCPNYKDDKIENLDKCFDIRKWNHTKALEDIKRLKH